MPKICSIINEIKDMYSPVSRKYEVKEIETTVKLLEASSGLLPRLHHGNELNPLKTGKVGPGAGMVSDKHPPMIKLALRLL